MTIEITEEEYVIIMDALTWRQIEAEHWLRDYEDNNEITHEIHIHEMKTLVLIEELKKKLNNLNNQF